MKRKTFLFDGQEIEVAPEVTEEEEKMTMDDIDEMYEATRMTDSDAADLFGVDISEVDLSDDEMKWLDKIIAE